VRKTRLRYRDDALDVTLEATASGMGFTNNRDASGFFVPSTHRDPGEAIAIGGNMMAIMVQGFRMAATEQRFERWLGWLPSRVVPKRVNDEVIGDAIEKINGMICQSAPSWRIKLVYAVTFAVVASECVRYFVRALRGRQP
jgi:hypothetical protein